MGAYQRFFFRVIPKEEDDLLLTLKEKSSMLFYTYYELDVLGDYSPMIFLHGKLSTAIFETGKTLGYGSG